MLVKRSTAILFLGIAFVCLVAAVYLSCKSDTTNTTSGNTTTSTVYDEPEVINYDVQTYTGEEYPEPYEGHISDTSVTVDVDTSYRLVGDGIVTVYNENKQLVDTFSLSGNEVYYFLPRESTIEVSGDIDLYAM